MPLPEHEQRQLQEIEQALYRDDPRFGRRMRADPQVRYQRTLIAAQLGVVIGVGLLPAGAVTNRLCLLAAGVVIVLVSLAWAAVSWRRYGAMVRAARSTAGTTSGKGTQHPPGPARRARMIKRMEARWRRRQHGNGRTPPRTRS